MKHIYTPSSSFTRSKLLGYIPSLRATCFSVAYIDVNKIHTQTEKVGEKWDHSNCNSLWNLSRSSEVDKMGFFTATLFPSNIASYTTLSAPTHRKCIQHIATININIIINQSSILKIKLIFDENKAGNQNGTWKWVLVGSYLEQ